MKITADVLASLASQARIGLDATRAASLLPQLNAALESIDALSQLNTQGVEPLSHVLPLRNAMRPDEVRQGYTREALLANAPQRTDEAFVVPKTVE